MWSYNNHQREGAFWALSTIRSFGLAYLSWKERTRKSGTALLTVEYSKAKHCLIVTKKRAIPGWKEHFKNHELHKQYTVINYESVHKLTPELYDFIVLDEAHHAISSTGRPSKTWKTVKQFTKGKPVLYLSATPYAEHLGLIFHQLKLSDWCPFKARNFYDWFRQYGIPHKTRTPYGLQETYSKYKKEDILAKIEHLFNFKTRQEVGIEHEPTVKVIKVEPTKDTIAIMKAWREDRVITINGIEILGDSDSKVRSVHYQLEGATIKINDTLSIRTKSNEKINYIKSSYNLNNIAIMAHFIEERELLRAYFPEVPIYSSDGHAEGVDLSHVKKLLIYSMSFKTSKHTQRIARQANHEREEPIEVDILVMDKPGIGLAVYNTVAVKMTNFIKDSYERSTR